MRQLPPKAAPCTLQPCAASSLELPSGLALLQHSLLPGTLRKGDKEKAPCDTRNIKLSKEKQRELGQKGAFSGEQAANSATRASPPAPVPQPGPGLPTRQCPCLGHCHHPHRRGTRLGTSPGRSHCSPLLPLRRAMPGWLQAGASPGCRQWMGRQVEVEASQTQLCLFWMSALPSMMLGALGAAGR